MALFWHRSQGGAADAPDQETHGSMMLTCPCGRVDRGGGGATCGGHGVQPYTAMHKRRVIRECISCATACTAHACGLLPRTDLRSESIEVGETIVRWRHLLALTPSLLD